MNVRDFSGREPRLRLEDYFNGGARAWGVFQDRFGRPRREFEVEIQSEWDGSRLTLTEDFTYDDGQTEQRVWRIATEGEFGYVAEADDMIGRARGEAHGNALNWNYRFRLPIGERSLAVRFDDWFFLNRDGVLVNRALVTKFGFAVGSMTIVFNERR